MKYIGVLLLAISFSLPVFSQSSLTGLYTPLEFQKAYKRGTRKADGSVSPLYWQNRSEYKIKAKIDPGKKILYGEATIIYHNNGPDTVRSPSFHTYPDYYKPDSPKARFFSTASLNNDGMIIDKITVANEVIDLKDVNRAQYNGTNYTIRLTKPIPPKGKLQLQISWHYTIPGKGFERSGAIDNTSMFIAYWYPEMAVLDDIDGWDRIVYDASTEFYHDYSDYEIEIEAPDNFVVWASVAPANEAEVYSAAVRERLAKARKSTEPVAIITAADFKTKSVTTIKWKYTAKDFPDFAFALSDHFVWDAAMHKDNMGSYFIHAVYPTDHPAFSTVCKTISGAIKIFHTEFPVYPFPYTNFTVFNGLEGGGMEFPGMANDESVSGEQMEEWTGMKMTDYEANLGLTLHEMCHMYFPFMMGIHEKKYAWMDEGMASFSEFFLKRENEYDMAYLADQSVAPVMVPSYLLKSAGINSYTIGSYSYHALYSLLGKEEFQKCLNVYMDTWKHKHPTPYDFMFTFNRVSGKDLNWFWKRWYFDWGYMDLGIKEVKGNVVTVENLGGRPLACDAVITFADNTSVTMPISPLVWKDAATYPLVVTGGKEIRDIALKIPSEGDANRGNNHWKK